MSTVSLLQDAELSPRAAAVFADIRATRQTDFVNNFWRALAHDPALLERTWASAKQVMAAGALDAKTKELIYIAASVAQGCDYCVASHTAAARAKGMSPAEHMELVSVIGMAAQTNRLALALQVPVDEVFKKAP